VTCTVTRSTKLGIAIGHLLLLLWY
jgi:hypothetical protein